METVGERASIVGRSDKKLAVSLYLAKHGREKHSPGKKLGKNTLPYIGFCVLEGRFAGDSSPELMYVLFIFLRC